MKIIIVTIINLIIDPYNFIKFIIWSKRLKYLPEKRLQFILLSVNIAFFHIIPKFKIKLYFAQLTAILFELDNYIDKYPYKKGIKFKDYLNNLSNTGETKKIIDSFINQFPLNKQSRIKKSLQDWINSSWDHTNSYYQSDTIEGYLDKSFLTIGIPCLTELVDIYRNYIPNNEELIFIKQCANLVRISNDSQSIERDKIEDIPNVFNLFNKAEVKRYFNNSIKMYNDRITIMRKKYNFLIKITSLSMNLYKDNDFEL